MDWKTVLLGVSLVATGLMSGLWYGWVVSVIPGTRRVADANYVDTMQRINRAIINPGFIVAFMGIPIVVAIAAVLQFRGGWVNCEMTADRMTISSQEDAVRPIQVAVAGEEFELAPGAVREVALT